MRRSVNLLRAPGGAAAADGLAAVEEGAVRAGAERDGGGLRGQPPRPGQPQVYPPRVELELEIKQSLQEERQNVQCQFTFLRVRSLIPRELVRSTLPRVEETLCGTYLVNLLCKNCNFPPLT